MTSSMDTNHSPATGVIAATLANDANVGEEGTLNL